MQIPQFNRINLENSTIEDSPARKELDKNMPKSATTADLTDGELRGGIVKLLPSELRNLLAGGMAGMTAKSFVAPADRIKILYQVTNVEFRLSNVPSSGMSIVRNEGFSALWRGNMATMLRVFPYSGVQFMVFDRCKRFVSDKHNNANSGLAWKGMTPIESLAAGSIAGVSSVIATYPLDLTRTQLALCPKEQGGKRITFLHILSKTYKDRGAMGLYRGITPTMLGILPYSGIAFTINEQSKRWITNMQRREPNTIEKMVIGAVSGLIAQSVTYPLEVTRRRMQTIGLVQNDSSSALKGARAIGSDNASRAFEAKPVSMTETMKFLFREQGIKGFYKGLTMNWVKTPISFGISFTMYDAVKKCMGG